MKTLISILAATFIFLGAYSFARSEEVCTNPFPEFVETVTSVQGNTVKPITDAEREQLYAKKGPPPIAEPFDVDVAKTETAGMIVIVKDGCIVGNIGPVPLQVLNNLLGTSGA